MRCADIFLAFPYVLFVVAMIAVIGRGLQNVFIAIGILGWPSIARVFRSAILTVKENDYVDAARAMGASDARIVVRHIFPNSVASIVVYATMNIGGAILTESALSFLGMGVIPPTLRGVHDSGRSAVSSDRSLDDDHARSGNSLDGARLHPAG